VALCDLDRYAATSPTWALINSIRSAIADGLGCDLRLRGYSVGKNESTKPPHASPWAGSYHIRRQVIDFSRHIFQAGDTILGVRGRPWTDDELSIVSRIVCVFAHEHFHTGIPSGYRGPGYEGFTDLMTTLSHDYILRRTGLADRDPRLLQAEQSPAYVSGTSAIAAFVCAAADLSDESPMRTLDRILTNANYFAGLSAVVKNVAARHGSGTRSVLSKTQFGTPERMVEAVCQALYRSDDLGHRINPQRSYAFGIESGREAGRRMCDGLGIDSAARLDTSDPLARFKGGHGVAQAVADAVAKIDITAGPSGWFLVNRKTPSVGPTVFPQYPSDELLQRLASLPPREDTASRYLSSHQLWYITDLLQSRNWFQKAFDKAFSLPPDVELGW
jgi:hypothetical protein